MRIFLARPAYSTMYGLFTANTESKQVVPPTGLMYVAAALEGAGHTVAIADGEAEGLPPEVIAERATAFRPDFVGLGAAIVDFQQANEVLRIVKDRLGVVTVLGGPHGTTLPDETLRQNPHIDFLVRGEGEETAVELVRVMEDGREYGNIPGLSYRSNGGIQHSPDRSPLADLNTLPLPARHLIRPELYLFPDPRRGMRRASSVQSCRGCPHSCAYCFHMFGRRTRFRAVQLVVDEIEKCLKEYGTEYIVFLDDTFTLNRQRVMEMCDEILRRGLRFPWLCLARADTIWEDMLVKMREAGCEQVSIGVESGNQQILDSVRKGVRLEQLESACSLLKKLGFQTRGSFILGLPHENRRTIRNTIDFAKHLKLDRAFFNIFTPYPGTEAWQQAERGDGCRLVTRDWSQFKRHGHAVIELCDTSRDELIDLQRVATMEFYCRPSIIWNHLLSFVRGARQGFYYRPLWFGIRERVRRVVRKGLSMPSVALRRWFAEAVQQPRAKKPVETP